MGFEGDWGWALGEEIVRMRNEFHFDELFQTTENIACHFVCYTLSLVQLKIGALDAIDAFSDLLTARPVPVHSMPRP